MLLEVCVDNYESACAAINGGAGRLELCAALSEGGLTPTPGLLKQVQTYNTHKIPVFCMLRCRSSDFCYTQEDIAIMMEDAQILKESGANGFVFGALLENGQIDMRKCRDIIRMCYPLPVTFHRAFDLLAKPTIDIHVIIDIGFTRVLTSGQAKTAKEGTRLIKKLVDEVQGRLIVMPGAGITKDNIRFIAQETGAVEFHGSFRLTKEENIEKDTEVKIGENDNEDLKIASQEIIAEIVESLKNI